MQVFPTVAVYSPNGEFDILPYTAAFDPEELRAAITNTISDSVKRVEAREVRRFLQLDPEFYGKTLLSRFSILLLKSQYDTSRFYLRDAINNQHVASFGAAEPHDKSDILKQLSLDAEKNLLVSYLKYGARGDTTQVLQPLKVDVEQLGKVISAVRRHTIVGIFPSLIISI